MGKPNNRHFWGVKEGRKFTLLQTNKLKQMRLLSPHHPPPKKTKPNIDA